MFFALGGTSFAATNAVLAKNTVGTRQVIDGSLRTSDLSKPARSALAGSRGATGHRRLSHRVRRRHHELRVLATAGQDVGSLTEDYHVYTSRTGTSTVDVLSFDENDDPLDRPFFLAVFC